MRTAWLITLFFIIILPPACSGNDGGDGSAGGSAGTSAGGTAGSGVGGAGGSPGAGGSAMAGVAGTGSAAGSGGTGAAGMGGSAESGGSGGAGGSSSNSSSDCRALCARSVVCSACLSECEHSVELCPDQFAALLACGETLPDSDFQCLGDLVIPNDDLCVRESAAFARCRIGF
jgi:hypothetical protein